MTIGGTEDQRCMKLTHIFLDPDQSHCTHSGHSNGNTVNPHMNGKVYSHLK